jgi:heptosyltransferase-1
MKILVVKLSSLGDILHMFPAVSDLRRRFPEAEIHWLVEPAFAEVVGWHSAINNVIAVPLRSYKARWWKIPALLGKLRRRLKAEHYDIVLDAQGLLKSALLSRLAGVAVFGFDANSARESLAARFYQKSANVPDGLHVIEKNRQLVAKIFAADITQPVDFSLAKFRCKQMQAESSGTLREIGDQPYIVLLHGTTWNSKYWPEPAWFDLIRMLSQRGWRCVLPWGNEAERQRAYRLQAAGNELAQVLPKLSLTDLMGVLLHAHAFVSVESGIGHLAAALDVPGVMLHGPTSPNYSGILGKACLHLTSGLACSPCFKRECPILLGAIDPPCQREISALRVYQHCLTLIPENVEAATRQTDKIPKD